MSLDLGVIPPRKTTADQITDLLRSAISQGKLASGQSLRQDEIAAEFKVSKIPVREALSKLQTEGLVEIIPNRGAVVSSLSQNEINQIYLMRSALDPIALCHAIPKMTAADFTRAEQALDAIDAVEDIQTWAGLNWDFHDALYRPSGMDLLVETVKVFHANVVRYLLHSPKEPDFMAVSQREHRDILTLCKQGAVEKASECLKRHLNSANDLLVQNDHHTGDEPHDP